MKTANRLTSPSAFPVGAVLLAGIALVAGCASMASSSLDDQVAQMMKASFRDQGIAKVERLHQDRSNDACSKAMGQPLPEPLAKSIEGENLRAVKMPAGSVFLGDWKEGEKLAQSGRGMTWTDPSAEPKDNGGNCYNCHQISKAEISYGTIGPSLYQYGKLRGVVDPGSAAAKPIVEYTWQKLYNAKAFNACSEMPRMGAMLSEKQLQDIMALLLDPMSPVNQ
jgi:L-cysteine S-thiosulfotransferase